MDYKNNKEMRLDHEAIRKEVGYYDFTHQMIEVKGPDMGKFMDRIFANKMFNLRDGQAKYTQMLNEDGIIIDDLIVFKLEDDRYWITTLFIDQMKEVFREHVDGYDVDYKDVTDDYVMYAIQGPKSLDVMNKVVDDDVTNMSWFSIKENEVGDIPVHVSRAGYTGERGYEIYVNSKYKDEIFLLLEEKGKDFNIRNTTSDAILFTLPREKGYVLMDDIKDTYPLESGFDWAVAWKTDFIGKEALETVKEKGVNRQLYGFELVDNDVDEPGIETGDKIMANGEEVGEVRTISYGFTVEKFIGYALVNTDKVDIGDSATINDVDVKIVERMWYDPDNERIRK